MPKALKIIDSKLLTVKTYKTLVTAASAKVFKSKNASVTLKLPVLNGPSKMLKFKMKKSI